MNPVDLSTTEALDALSDRSLILTRGGIVLQKWSHFNRTDEHAWHRPGHSYDYSYTALELTDQAHQPIKFIASIAALA